MSSLLKISRLWKSNIKDYTNEANDTANENMARAELAKSFFPTPTNYPLPNGGIDFCETIIKAVRRDSSGNIGRWLARQPAIVDVLLDIFSRFQVFNDSDDGMSLLSAIYIIVISNRSIIMQHHANGLPSLIHNHYERRDIGSNEAIMILLKAIKYALHPNIQWHSRRWLAATAGPFVVNSMSAANWAHLGKRWSTRIWHEVLCSQTQLKTEVPLDIAHSILKLEVGPSNADGHCPFKGFGYDDEKGAFSIEEGVLRQGDMCRLSYVRAYSSDRKYYCRAYMHGDGLYASYHTNDHDWKVPFFNGIANLSTDVYSEELWASLCKEIAHHKASKDPSPSNQGSIANLLVDAHEAKIRKIQAHLASPILSMLRANVTATSNLAFELGRSAFPLSAVEGNIEGPFEELAMANVGYNRLVQGPEESLHKFSLRCLAHLRVIFQLIDVRLDLVRQCHTFIADDLPKLENAGLGFDIDSILTCWRYILNASEFEFYGQDTSREGLTCFLNVAMASLRSRRTQPSVYLQFIRPRFSPDADASIFETFQAPIREICSQHLNEIMNGGDYICED